MSRPNILRGIHPLLIDSLEEQATYVGSLLRDFAEYGFEGVLLHEVTFDPKTDDATLILESEGIRYRAVISFDSFVEDDEEDED